MQASNKRAAIDRSAAIPLYHQIFLQLRDEILSGQRPCGSIVGTEKEVSLTCGVSRITARRALAELAQHHFVARKRRVGTTVIYRPPAKPIEANMDQAVDSLLEFGRLTKVRVLEVQQEAASVGVAELMGLKAGDAVIRAVRVRYLDREPLGYVLSYVPAALAPHITREGLTHKPVLKLIKNAGFRLGKASQTVAAVLADPVLCRHLAVEPRSAILRITRSVFDQRGNPLLLTVAHYRSDRYQLRLDLQH
ncbi:MAG TPA: GntR family transcriptional regulator [Steroidobacteraceae bacterium]